MTSLREKYPLENTKPLKKTISIIIVMIIAFVIALSFALAASSGKISNTGLWVFIIIIIAVLIPILKYIYEVYYMKTYFYDASKEFLIIRKGVFSISEIQLPFKKIQDVYVDQDILDRIFGLYDVHVSTATFVSGFLSHIDGLNKENSDFIKNLILKSVHGKNAK